MKKRKIYFFVSLFLLFTVCNSYAKSKEKKQTVNKEKNIPAWVADEGRLKMFPDSEYVSRCACASTFETAKSSAVTSISEYIKSTIKTETKTHYLSTNDTEINSVEENAELSSDNSLYQLDYTTPYYDDSSKNYYCVAYINRKKAFEYVKPRLEKVAQIFPIEYKKALDYQDSFQQIIAIHNSQKILKDFYEVYDFATAISPSNASAYKKIDILALESYAKIDELKSTVIVFIDAQGDCSESLRDKLNQVFTDVGFTVTANNNYKYKTIANFSIKITQTDKIFICYPTILVEVKKDSTIYSYSKSLSKVTGFDFESAQRRACYLIKKDLDENLFNN